MQGRLHPLLPLPLTFHLSVPFFHLNKPPSKPHVLSHLFTPPPLETLPGEFGVELPLVEETPEPEPVPEPIRVPTPEPQSSNSEQSSIYETDSHHSAVSPPPPPQLPSLPPSPPALEHSDPPSVHNSRSTTPPYPPPIRLVPAVPAPNQTTPPQPPPQIKMVQNITFDGHTYDISDPMDLTAYNNALVAALNNQTTQITALQNAPGLNQANFATLIAAITPAANQPHVPINNPVLSTGGHNVAYEEVPLEKGIKDIKDFPAPEPFTGRQTDATPFIWRLLGYFKAKPESMRFTRARILYACTLLQEGIAKTWANNVQHAITLSTAQDRLEHYTDSWDDFVTEFKKRFGLRDEKRYWFRLMMQYLQRKDQTAKNYTDQFDIYRKWAEVDKDQAMHYLRQNTFPVYRTALIMQKGAPKTYDDWVAALEELQTGLDEVKDAGRFDYRPVFWKERPLPKVRTLQRQRVRTYASGRHPTREDSSSRTTNRRAQDGQKLQRQRSLPPSLPQKARRLHA